MKDALSKSIHPMKSQNGDFNRMKCPRCASEIPENSSVCGNCGLVFLSSKKVKKKLLVISLKIFVVLLAFSLIFVYVWLMAKETPYYYEKQFPNPKLEGICEKYENGYIIYISSVKYKPSIFDFTYQLIDKNGNVIEQNGVEKIYGTDFEFRNYDLEPEPFRIKFHDNDIDGFVSVEDYFLIRGYSNFSTNEFYKNLNGYKFKLIFEPTGTYSLEVELNENAIFTTKDVIEHDINNKWTITNSSANSTIEIDTNKTALSNYPLIRWQKIKILLIIYNKNFIDTNLTLNLSHYYDNEENMLIFSNMTNETIKIDRWNKLTINITGKYPIPQNESVEVLISYVIRYGYSFMGHNISVEIFDKNSDSTLNASVLFKVSSRGITAMTSPSFSISLSIILFISILIAIFQKIAIPIKKK